MRDAEKYLAEHAVDIILLDLGLPDAQGLAAVQRAHAAAPHVPLVVLTGLDDQLVAAQALQEGAQDYLIKGQIETRGLMRALRYAGERKIMEEALFEEKERAQVTLHSIADAVICTDISGDITFLNVVAESDGLALAGSGWPADDRGVPRAERRKRWIWSDSGRYSQCPGSDRPAAVELHSYPPGWGRNPDRRLRRPNSQSRRAGHWDGSRFSRCERGPRNGAANRAFGRARFSDRVAQSNAPE